MLVRELMTPQVQTCRSNQALDAAAHILWERDIGAVAVLDDKDRVVGMLTDRDICMAAYTQGRPLAELVVAEAMSKEVIGCHADDTVAHVAGLMKRHQLRRLPVLDRERRPIGIITLADMVRARQATHGREVEIVTTLAAVSAPRPLDGAA